eukprot:8395463-Pyramimonas_sp.AAC.1
MQPHPQVLRAPSRTWMTLRDWTLWELTNQRQTRPTRLRARNQTNVSSLTIPPRPDGSRVFHERTSQLGSQGLVVRLACAA